MRWLDGITDSMDIGHAKSRVVNGFMECFPTVKAPSPAGQWGKEKGRIENHKYIFSLLVKS